ncbi:ribonuclease BN [Streptacidiphilus sp. ASG 303]|uniref:ribonuclease BN n=1 Tax=Streptacidiphilus sp. ASG 303 TaxID=2896847 RepID=UPI0027E19F15|nr:ribonuclease BN [Streptacidiphilus sp. ASG 303]
MRPRPSAVPWYRRLHLTWHRSGVRRGWRRGGELELMHRALSFSALGLVTLVPLLIVVAAADPVGGHGFAQWVVDGMGISGRSAAAVQELFAAPAKVLSTTSALSVAALAVFGLSFASVVQTGYERVWDMPSGPWHTAWRRVVWLTVLTAYLFADVLSGGLLAGRGPLRVLVTLTAAVLFFWWSQHFLLGGRLSWRRLLPGAVTTVAGLVGLRVFSSLVFAPLIVSNAVSYGAVGTVLIVQSWLIGAGVVVFGGALVGRELVEERERLRPHLHVHLRPSGHARPRRTHPGRPQLHLHRPRPHGLRFHGLRLHRPHVPRGRR